MNAKFLKTVGASSMKDFHTKYPDEKTLIAKCGAKIKKAYPGIKIPKGEAEYGAFFSQLLSDGTEAAKGAKVKKAFMGMAAGAGGAGGMLKGLTGGGGAAGAIQQAGGVGGIAGKIGGFIDARKAAKEAVKVAEQDSLVFGKLEDAQASNKINEQFNLQQARQDSYVKPEDNILTGEELFPMYGVGTNVLAKDGIHINPKNKGKFTASAKAAGHSVQEHAKHVLADPNASALQKKRANFARNAAKWKHQDGGTVPIEYSDYDQWKYRQDIDTTGLSTGKPRWYPYTNTKLTGPGAGYESKGVIDANTDGGALFDHVYPLRKDVQGNRVLNANRDFESQRMQKTKSKIKDEKGMNRKVSDKYKAEGGMFLGSTGQQWGAVGKEAMGTGFQEISKRLNFAPDDVGGQIGADVGGMAGKLVGGPVGEMVGKVAGKFIGDGLDRTDTQKAKFEGRTERSQNNMIGMNIGDRIQGNFGGNLKNGGSYEMGGDVQTFGQGGVSPLSHNPYAGEMGMINGPSHKKGGVPMKIYSDPQIKAEEGVTLEAEGGEPIMKTRDEGVSPIDGIAEGGESAEEMTILGNRFVPSHIKKAVESFSGEKFKGTKYKNIGKEVGKTESKLTSDIENYADKTKQYSDFREIDLISKGSLSLMSKIKDAKLKKLALVRDVLSQSQEAINEQEEGSKNSSIDAKKGTTIYAQEGTTITSKQKQSYLDKGYQVDPKNPNRLFKKGTDPVTVKGAPGVEGGTETKVVQEAVAPIKDTYSGEGGYASDEDWNKFLASKKGKEYQQKYVTGTPEVVEEVPVEGLQGFDDFELPGTPGDEIFIKDPKEREKIDWAGLIGGANLKGTDAEAFRNSQLLPEAWAMANNKLEPVQAQKFQPRLRVPYDISLQDQLNETTASARSAERMAQYNPGQLASLKAQEYMADSRVLGDQFRQNQQFKDQVYSGNLQTLNEAQLKNLAIADTQYTRQEQAKSNTKATDFEAIKSMTDKRAKHALENQTLRVMENLYNYRFDPAGRAQYRGPNADFSTWASENGIADTKFDSKKWEPLLNEQGEVVSWKKRKGRSQSTADAMESVGGISMRNGSIIRQIKKFK